ncbi:hypothetical protein GXB85_16370 [Cellulomonas sp. APG4]|uniref:hypothetical protein n=1 Tax=Cellulomonas sp. APG4 TaxID=1538656 RepID=UPI00137B7205|nr:hypothetical protein [Cellulomonas sp. APG4]
MDIVRDLMLVLHFVGLASLLGGFLVQMKSRTKRVEAAMFHGALTQLVTGLALVGIAEAGDADVNHMKVGLKLVVLVAITALVLVGRRKESVSTGVWGAIGGLTLVNVVIAVVV